MGLGAVLNRFFFIKKSIIITITLDQQIQVNFLHKKIKVQLNADALGQYTINPHSLVGNWY